jgi:hypothetical protein
MVATVTIVEKNGAGATATDKTSGTIRFKNADDATVNTANPMVVPPSGTDFSFEKWLRLKVTGGTYTDISNIRAYMDGANGFGTGIGLYAKAVTAYATPAEATATTGYTDAFSYTSGSPLDLGGDGSTGTGEKGDHLVMMMTVASTASGGMLTAETLTVAWDEI